MPENTAPTTVDLPVDLNSEDDTGQTKTPGPTGLGKTRERLRVMDESDLSVLRERAESGDKDAVDQLIELAGEQGNLDELRRLADQGNTTASEVLRELED